MPRVFSVAWVPEALYTLTPGIENIDFIQLNFYVGVGLTVMTIRQSIPPPSPFTRLDSTQFPARSLRVDAEWQISSLGTGVDVEHKLRLTVISGPYVPYADNEQQSKRVGW